MVLANQARGELSAEVRAEVDHALVDPSNFGAGLVVILAVLLCAGDCLIGSGKLAFGGAVVLGCGNLFAGAVAVDEGGVIRESEVDADCATSRLGGWRGFGRDLDDERGVPGSVGIA